MITTSLRWVRSNAVALVALTVAMGGTSYAVAALPKNSVTSRAIAPDAVRSGDVKNGSLLRRDFKAGQLPRGATGAQGAPGRSALTTLRIGETVTGVVGMDTEVAAAGGDLRTWASFPIPGTTGPLQVRIDGAAAETECTGVAGAPTAPNGFLCVYPQGAVNPVFGPLTHEVAYRNRLGFSVVWGPVSSGDTFFYGTYAYTQGD
ncbi:hypothetical protein [Nocardioides lijunqiniae]|uniref:hypothetical protein n=1 Tax=Nocardioides lijunqiniae TaxID=2760832 RepID=UPI001877885E|nr:hypothetical protein [Nocardioides lijunqiniae]